MRHGLIVSHGGARVCGCLHRQHGMLALNDMSGPNDCCKRAIDSCSLSAMKRLQLHLIAAGVVANRWAAAS